MLPRATALLLGLLLAGGCPGPESGDPDAGPDAEAPGGLTFQFTPDPALPATLGGAFATRVERLTVRLESVRAIGDSAPGGEHTTHDLLDLQWESAGSRELVFEEAPPGRYSRLDAWLTDFEVAGQVTVASQVRRFEIDDQPAVPIGISIPLDDVTVQVGVTRQVHIAIDLSRFTTVDWATVPPDEEGDLTIGEEDAQLAALKVQIGGAFTMTGQTTISGP